MKRLILLLLAFPGVAHAEEECTTTTTTRCTGEAAHLGVPQPAPQLAPPMMLWREQPVSTASAPVWGAGLAMLSASWLAGGVSSFRSAPVSGIGLWPVLGAWTEAAAYHASCSDNSRCSGEMPTALWVVDGLVQAAGLATLIAGFSAGPKKMARVPVLLVPGIVGTGGGVSAAGRF